jgi:hypothetical protein
MCIPEAATLYVSRLQPYVHQVSGYALPFTRAGPIDRDRREPPRRAGAAAATPRHPGCNPTAPRLQPHGTQAATPWHPGCNPMAPRLQPHGTQAATPWHPGCNPMAPGLQPCTS